MIHQFKSEGYNIILDVNSGSVHVVDDLVYDLVKTVEAIYEGGVTDVDTMKAAVNVAGDMTATEEEVDEAVEEIMELAKAGKLFSKDVYEPYIDKFKEGKHYVKALCLHIAHDCNLAC
ncbi:MAG: thioether cross-link-forming SCIFF peptide maturase, partial [Lachnospiraceae bacterium]|nr:thioether cross-link-forming SCIFF peptide maturase [Lachnospiraceae bacterium]